MNIQLKDLLQKSFVISIDDRQLQFQRQRFAEIGLSPFPKHFKGFTLANKTYKLNGLIKYKNACNCGLSHEAIIKFAQAQEWPYVCIFEDDAWPCNDIVQQLEQLLSSLPDDVALLRLGWLNKCKVDAEVDVQQPYRRFLSSSLGGSHAYVVFKCYYETAVHKLEDTLTADGAILSDKTFLCIGPKKSLFVQYSPSNIDRCLHGIWTQGLLTREYSLAELKADWNIESNLSCI